MSPVRSLLVADEGPCALRVARACRELGIRSVVGWRASGPVPTYALAADVAVPLDSAEEWLAIAVRHGVDAVHPGASGLAVDVDFAAEVFAAGLVFVGAPARWTGEAAPVALVVDLATDRRGDTVVLGARVPSGRWGPDVVVFEGAFARSAAVAVDAARELGHRGLGACALSLVGAELTVAGFAPHLLPEHALTEELSGVDVVSLQLALATGAPVVRPPSPSGAAAALRLRGVSGAGPSGPGVRWDEGPDESWLTARAETREGALARLRRGLHELAGVDVDRLVQGLEALASGAAEVQFESYALRSPPPEVLEDAAIAATLFARSAAPPPPSEWGRASRLDGRRGR